MSHFKTFGRPKSVSVTPKTGSLGAIKGVLSFKPIYNPEAIKEIYSDSRQASYYEAEDVQGCVIVTKDADAYHALKKNTRVTSVSATVEGAIAAGSTTAAVANELTFSLSGGIVTEATDPDTVAGGTPSEFSITIMVCRDPVTGVDGTCTITKGGAE